MPRQHRPATSGYARIAQADEEDAYLDESDEGDPLRTPKTISTSINSRYAPIQPHLRPQMHADAAEPYQESQKKSRRRRRSSSGVDIKAINARFERWAEEIAAKFKSSKHKDRSHDENALEIQHSVFQAPAGMIPLTSGQLNASAVASQAGRMNKMEFDDVVESVRTAIELAIHPKMISQGSSGSYFARNSEGKVVGVFKPKDEEPYASRNPKWTKWIHRNLFPCFFGRACLIPNLSYVSEAAAYTLDTRLQTNLVPYTDIIWLSSKSFHYDFWDKSAYYRKGKPLPMKVGSLQVFLKGFKDANIFLRENPWPDQVNAPLSNRDGRRKTGWTETCRPSTEDSDEDDTEANNSRSIPRGRRDKSQQFRWTEPLKQSLREELEKLVILDYIMRNTDRGLDNWMIRVDADTEKVTIVTDLPRVNMSDSTYASSSKDARSPSSLLSPYKQQETMSFESSTNSPTEEKSSSASISIGAIDNSLSWPWKHPDAWRSFPFGWLFLPVSLIGQPFCQKTREHFLPLLTSTIWWSETQQALRTVFAQDSDFKESMFARQIAVMKGQAWNVTETLKTPGHGPLELTRRPRVCVWDDLVEIPIAIPMRTPSAEMNHRQNSTVDGVSEDEEMDISSAANRHTRQQSILIESNGTELPNPNRFDLSRNNSSSDVRKSASATASSANNNRTSGVSSGNGRALYDDSRRPTHSGGRQSLSYEGRSRGERGQARRFSMSSKFGATSYEDLDDLEGDIGYSAAEGMDRLQRQVIVERLETVKSKNPVFSWC